MKRTSPLVGLTVVLVFCFAPAVFAADGFGQNTIGGAGGTVVTVDSNAADFKAYVETIDTPYIVQVSGTIDLNSVEDRKVRIRSNKTIKGIDPNATIIGELGFKKGSSNVIIERLNITNPDDYGEGDGISVKEDINDVFITKCTIYDCWDGLLDITRRSDWVTVSWCKFYFTTPNNGNNNRVTLIGADDGHTDDLGKLHITFHHNWYGTYCIQRIPSVRFGRVHIYNNYYNCPGNDYCVWSRIKAECLIENNYFKGVNNPYYAIDYYGDEKGKIEASGNLTPGCTGEIDDGTDDVFDPNYSYILDDAEDVPTIVQNGAGADGNDSSPPHWAFGPYGDFDRNDIVDMNDLEQFVDYWLDTNDIDDADYYDDGVVNGREFALFASNWLVIPPDTTAPVAPTNLTASDGDETVSLEWDDNTEEDLDGYNIYRSTTYGIGYTKLNGPLLTDSNYIDNTVTNSTVYFYYVTALDTSSNESGGSSKVSAIPIDANTIIIQENTTGFCGLDGGVETGEHSGYTGYGYANTDNDPCTGVDWSINIASGGMYTFKWRFANGTTSDRSARLLVNDSEKESSISFPGTGAWENWSEVSAADVNLSTGIKDIRLEALSTSTEGLANIDYIMVTGPGVEVASCP